MRHIPDDVLVNILSRLPSKSLLRFRCVCKSWYSIITNDSFCTLHRHNFDDHLIRWVSLNPSNSINPELEVQTTYLSLYDTSFTAISHQPLLILDIVDTVPYRTKFKIIASCHGVLCLLLETWRRFDQISYSLYLSNPSIRQCKQVISFKVDGNNLYYRRPQKGLLFAFGFGFAPKSNDYKLVMMSQDSNQIYSLKTNTWCKIRAKPSQVFFPRIPDVTYVNGACHWLNEQLKCDWFKYGHKIFEGDILCFNLDVEEFGYIKLPHDIRGSKRNTRDLDVDVFVYKDMLAVSFYDEDKLAIKRTLLLHVWVMKQYGVEDSWTNLISGFSILNPDFLNPLPPFNLDFIVPPPIVLETDDGSIILFWNGSHCPTLLGRDSDHGFLLSWRDCHPSAITLCNPQSLQIKNSQVLAITRLLPYKETLVLLQKTNVLNLCMAQI